MAKFTRTPKALEFEIAERSMEIVYEVFFYYIHCKEEHRYLLLLL